MSEYGIYALKYAGLFQSSGAFLMWMKDWEKTVERNYYLIVRGIERKTVFQDRDICCQRVFDCKSRFLRRIHQVCP